MIRKDRSDYKLVRALKPDYKVTDTDYGAAVTSTGTIYNLIASLTPGTGYKNNYIGREIQPVGLDLRLSVVGALSNAFAAADLNNITRIMVFQWLDDATPTIGSTLEGAAAISPIEITNYNNIEVLYDETFPTWVTVYDSGSTYGSSNSHFKRIYVKGKKMRNIELNGSTGGSIKGGIYLLTISDSAIAPNPTFSLYSRLSFLDS